MDVKISDLSTLRPKDITILNDPDASTITLSDPTSTITIATDALAITTSAEDSNLQDLKNVTITSVANGQLLAYDSSTSKWVNSSSTTGVSSVNTQTGAVTLDTDDIQEDGSPTNKYFTDARARASISASGSLSYNSGTGALTYTQGNTDTVAEGSSNLYYTNARFDTQLGTKTTANLTEGSNKYYTDARVLTKINATDLDALADVHTATPTDGQVLTWDNSNSYWKPATSSTAPVTSVNSLTGAVSLNSGLIPELTNLYYTDARARASNSVTKLTATNESNLTYDSSNGTFTFTPCDARAAINVTSNSAGDVSSLSYNSSTGTLTFTPADASTKLPLTGGALTGALTTNSTIDGVDIATRDAVLTTTTTTANAALPKAGGTMSGDIAMGSQKITGLGTPTNNDDATSKTYVDSAVSSGGGAVTSYTNGTDNRVVTSTGANGINGESGFTYDGSNAVISGSAGGLTSPILELQTDNSGWNRPLMMLKDSNDDVSAVGGENNTSANLYTYNFTMDPNNTKGRTGVTTFAGDYFFGFSKNYSDQSEITMDMNVYGAHTGFNISAFDDFNSNNVRYTAKPINLKGNEINLFSSDTSTPFGNFTRKMTVRPDAVDIEVDISLDDSKALNFDDFGTTVTTVDLAKISAKGSYLVNVDSDNSGNEAFKVQSAGTDALTIERGPGAHAETTLRGDGFFIKDDAGKTNFSMDLSSATQTGINVIRSNENKTLSFTLKTDDDDDTGNYDGSWSFRTNGNEKSMILERIDGGTTADIFEVRDSADVATANPTDIFEFKIPPVLPSFVVASLPTTVVAGAQAFCTNETGGAVNVFYDGSNWRRCTDRAVAS